MEQKEVHDGSWRLIKKNKNVCEYLILIKTSPFLKMKSRMLSVVTSWKFAFFSLAKKRSGFHKHWNILGSIVSESLLKSVGSRRRGSFHL